ncbi:MAG: hypothetical protein GTO41_27825 [Burkholderiales bacterium]|nr:hypothetical protein [Burkholderiales bacterium]
MNDQPVHRLYLHFQELPWSMRVLYTAALLVLGMGYCFAMIYVWASHAGRDGDPSSLSVQDIQIAYSGSKESSRLEAALRGPMSGMLPPGEISEIVAWVHRGIDKGEYERDIKPIMEKRCMACHDGSNPHLPNLKGYEHISESAELDTGVDVFTLVRVSHIHLFGLTFIFFIVGLIFSRAFVRPVWFKCAVVGLPFLAISVDVISWYLTKLFPPFAWAVLLAGAVMGLCFAYMWVISMYQMWFYKVPAELAEREITDSRVLG